MPVVDGTRVRRWVGWYLAVGGWVGVFLCGALAIAVAYRSGWAGVRVLPIALLQLFPAWCGWELLRGTSHGYRWAPIALLLQIPVVNTHVLWYGWFDGIRLVPYLRVRDAVAELNFTAGVGASTELYFGHPAASELVGVNIVALGALLVLRWAAKTGSQ